MELSLLQMWLRDMRSKVIQQVPPIVCESGLEMSVQASKYHYCTPRDNTGPWTHVEIGYPTMVVPEFEPYGFEDGTVFEWVPIEIVERVIEKNGGFSGKVDK